MSRRLPSICLPVVVLVVTVLSVRSALEVEQRRSQAAQGLREDAVAAEIARATERSVVALGDLRSELETTRVPRSSFARIAGRAMERSPLAAVGWAPLVRAADLRAYETGRGVRVRSLPGFGHGDVVLPIDGLVGRQPLPADYTAVDIWVAKPVRDALYSAVDRDRPVLSSTLGFGEPLGSGTIVLVPIYEPGAPLATPGLRRQALRGAVGGIIRYADLASDLKAAGLTWSTTVRANGVQLVTIGEGGPTGPGRRLEVGGRAWTVSVAAPATSHLLPAAVGVAGVVATLLLALLLVHLGRRQRMEARLRASEARARTDAEEQSALRRVAEAAAAGEDIDRVLGLAAEQASLLLAQAEVVIVATDGGDGQGGGTVRGVSAGARARGILPGAAVAVAELSAALIVPVQRAGLAWGVIAVGSGVGDVGLPPGAVERAERLAALVALACESAEGRAALSRQASTDPLTGFANQRAFQRQLEDALARSLRDGGGLSVAMMDLDHFKTINDALGHQVGDAVLAAVARAIAGALGEGALLGRIGGDEFAAVLAVEPAEARRRVEAARAAVAALVIPHDGVQVGLSVGLCDLASASDADDLVRFADQALYLAKERGRNGVVVYVPNASVGRSALERAESLARSQSLLGLRALARAVDAKSPATERHAERVAELATLLAGELGWDAASRAQMSEAAFLHDVGKIGVPDALLNKPGRLTPAEYELVKGHADLGARIAAEILTREQVAWIRGHHERLDGRGYPDALAGDAISQGARILALADAWDVMTSGRDYQSSLTAAEALAECEAQVGAQFDAHTVGALARLLASGELGHRAPLADAA